MVTLLIYIHLHEHLPRLGCSVRGGVFFAGVGLAFSQLALNTVLNSVSTGMDIAGLWPRYINIRRGAYIMAIVCTCLTHFQNAI
jgi:NCS1 family nucleobase:cation symporter-1